MKRMSLKEAIEVLKDYGEDVIKNKDGKYSVISIEGASIMTGHEVVRLAKDRQRMFYSVMADRSDGRIRFDEVNRQITEIADRIVRESGKPNDFNTRSAAYELAVETMYS